MLKIDIKFDVDELMKGIKKDFRKKLKPQRLN